MRDAAPKGSIADTTEFLPGLSLHADPSLRISGQWSSPVGRLLELDLRMTGRGAWIGLHVALQAEDLAGYDWLGYTYRGVAPQEVLIRACLRSGTQAGFRDCFFDKHVLTTSETGNHVDALHLPTRHEIPDMAPWRELVLFLPRQDFRWHLHDLRLFLI
jgi:hypothetical protein